MKVGDAAHRKQDLTSGLQSQYLAICEHNERSSGKKNRSSLHIGTNGSEIQSNSWL